jgi:hypothetical protein
MEAPKVTHAHITSWLVALILFFIILSFQKQGKNIRVLKMALRFFYLLIIGTGLLLLFSIVNVSALYILKLLVGLWIMGILETIIARNTKGKSLGMFWAQFGIAFLLVLYLGFKLPLGFHFFS